MYMEKVRKMIKYCISYGDSSKCSKSKKIWKRNRKPNLVSSTSSQNQPSQHPKVLNIMFLPRFFVSYTKLSKHLSVSHARGWVKGYCKHIRKALTLKTIGHILYWHFKLPCTVIYILIHIFCHAHIY